MFPRILTILTIVSLSCFGEANAQKPITAASAPPPQSDLFDLSVGYNYIHLGDAYPETEHLHGVDASFFVNATSWLAVGGDFMANFGNANQQRFYFGQADVDSERYVYVFGPRVTVWQSPQFRIFLEALAGGVHAEANAHFSFGDRRVEDDAFATAVGGGVEWRFANHWAWRIIQTDHLFTSLGNDWQTNFRASTGLVYSFGQR